MRCIAVDNRQSAMWNTLKKAQIVFAYPPLPQLMPLNLAQLTNLIKMSN